VLVGRRLPNLVFLVGLAMAFALRVAPAWGAPKDAAAMRLDRDAIDNDYLAMKFGDAEKKLKQALALCGKTGCSPNVVAQVHRDLGIVYVVASRVDEAKAQFSEALQADPSITIPKELGTPEIEQAFAAAKGGATAPGATAPPAGAPTGPSPPAAPSGGGDNISHTPPAEQAILTPVPIYAEMPDGLSPAKVQIRYRPFGATDWKSVDMRRTKTGYGAEIPCVDVGTTTGDLKYYIQALSPNGDVIATSGTKNAPHKVVIKGQLAGEPPHLPGKPAPTKCSGPGAVDCPPGFPGCESQKKKGPGFSCEDGGECESTVCQNGTCTAREIESKCESDAGCDAGQWCKKGVCAAAKKNWLGGAIQQDALLLPAATNVCYEGAEYSCYDGDGQPYGVGQPQTVQNNSDEIALGFAPSTTRFLLAFDHVVASRVSIGARVGYAIGGGPAQDKPFFPAHIEARVAYWLVNEPFIALGVRPYILGGVGAGQFDAKVDVKVWEQNGPTGRPINTSLTAWRKAGIPFGTLGFGLMYALDHDSGILAELKALQAWTTTGFTFQLGYSRGVF